MSDSSKENPFYSAVYRSSNGSKRCTKHKPQSSKRISKKHAEPRKKTKLTLETNPVVSVPQVKFHARLQSQEKIKKSRRKHDRYKIAASRGYKCGICREILGEHFDIDHIEPFAISFNDEESNLQALCLDCHRTKTLSDLKLIKKYKTLGTSDKLCIACGSIYSKYFPECWHCNFLTLFI